MSDAPVLFVTIHRDDVPSESSERYRASSIGINAGGAVELVAQGQAVTIPDRLWDSVEVRRHPWPDFPNQVHVAPRRGPPRR
jgi:hypothetical protein